MEINDKNVTKTATKCNMPRQPPEGMCVSLLTAVTSEYKNWGGF